jgi:hypothetical protein
MGDVVHGGRGPWGTWSMGNVVHGERGPWETWPMGNVVHGERCPWGTWPMGNVVYGGRLWAEFPRPAHCSEGDSVFLPSRACVCWRSCWRTLVDGLVYVRESVRAYIYTCLRVFTSSCVRSRACAITCTCFNLPENMHGSTPDDLPLPPWHPQPTRQDPRRPPLPPDRRLGGRLRVGLGCGLGPGPPGDAVHEFRVPSWALGCPAAQARPHASVGPAAALLGSGPQVREGRHGRPPLPAPVPRGRRRHAASGAGSRYAADSGAVAALVARAPVGMQGGGGQPAGGLLLRLRLVTGQVACPWACHAPHVRH